jgi:membrane-bound lytic murein transglycosylase D
LIFAKFRPLMTKRKILFHGALLFVLNISWSQELKFETDSLVIMSPDSLQEEFYVVAPAIEYVPADDSPELIQDRLSCIQSTIPLTYDRMVQGFIDYFTIRGREYTKSAIRKKDIYFPIFERYLKEYGLPDELKYLSIIESGLSPEAISRARAVGLWQFMSTTGKQYGLQSSWYWDDRMDPEKSTQAACRYLADLYNIFHDWPMALAAYNAGPGNVLKARRKAGYKNDFWQIYPYLPKETRSYVPQFIAIIYAMKYANYHNFYEPNPEQIISYDTLVVKTFLNLETYSSLTGACIGDLRQLNPQLRTNAIPDNGKEHVLRIPSASKFILNNNRTAILDSAARTGREQFAEIQKKMEEVQYIYYRVRPGNTLGSIALRNGVKVQELKSWNGLSGNMIHPGQMLKIFTSGRSVQVASRPAKIDSGTNSAVYVVQPGDTLWDIAKKFNGISIESIKNKNGLTHNQIKPGQKLIIQ